jgi:hypothetical protein
MISINLLANGRAVVGLIINFRDLSQQAIWTFCIANHVTGKKSNPAALNWVCQQTQIACSRHPSTIISSTSKQTNTSGARTTPQWAMCSSHQRPQSPIWMPTISTTLPIILIGQIFMMMVERGWWWFYTSVCRHTTAHTTTQNGRCCCKPEQTITSTQSGESTTNDSWEESSIYWLSFCDA